MRPASRRGDLLLIVPRDIHRCTKPIHRIAGSVGGVKCCEREVGWAADSLVPCQAHSGIHTMRLLTGWRIPVSGHLGAGGPTSPSFVGLRRAFCFAPQMDGLFCVAPLQTERSRMEENILAWFGGVYPERSRRAHHRSKLRKCGRGWGFRCQGVLGSRRHGHRNEARAGSTVPNA
jgi:hypothetical protein